MNFGDLGGSSPLLAIYNAGRVAQVPGPDLAGLAEPIFDHASAAQIPPGGGVRAVRGGARRWASPAGKPTASRLRPNGGAPAIADAKRAEGGAGAARRAGRAAQPSGKRRLARRARSHRGFLRKARLRAGMGRRGWPDQNGASGAVAAAGAPATTASISSAFALPRDLGAGLDPDALAEAETTIASAIVTYAEQASGSRVLPSRVSPLIFASPSVVDPETALSRDSDGGGSRPPACRFQSAAAGLPRLARPLEAPRGAGQRRTSYECGDG